MPAPPTPVSGCPLKRVEVHNGLNPRIYDSDKPSNALSLTIENQKPANEDKANLVLLVHCGARRMLSIRINDLVGSSKGASEAISVDTQTLQTCIRVEEQDHTIYVHFKDERDFNVATCVLQRCGFYIKDRNNNTRMQTAADSPKFPSVPVTTEPAAGLGPRLSSITSLPSLEFQPAPLPGQDQIIRPPSEPQFPPINELQTLVPMPSGHYQSWPGSLPIGAPSAQPHSLPQMTTYIPQLNPYNFFLGKTGHESYRPLVSSPLRTSFSSGDVPQQLSIPTYNSHAESLHAASPAPRSVSLVTNRPNTQVEPWWLSNHQQAASETYNKPAVPEVPHENATNDGFAEEGKKQIATAEEFRKMLPQRRNLPFARPQIAEAVAPESTQSVEPELPIDQTPANRPTTQKPKKRRSSPAGENLSYNSGASCASKLKPTGRSQDEEANPASRQAEKSSSAKKKAASSNKQAKTPDSFTAALTGKAKKSKMALAKKANPGAFAPQGAKPTPKRRGRNAGAIATGGEHTSHLPSSSPRIPLARSCKRTREHCIAPAFVDAESQTDSDPAVPTSSSLSHSCSYNQKENHNLVSSELPLLVTDSMLQQVNEATSKVLDQYELDIKGGSGTEARAQFYLDRILNVRRDFWYTKLLELEGYPSV